MRRLYVKVEWQVVRVRIALIQSVPNNWIDTRVKGSVALEIGLNSQVQWYTLVVVAKSDGVGLWGMKSSWLS